MVATAAAGAKRRATFALEIAKGLALGDDRRFWQAKLTIAGVGEGGAPLVLFASDTPDGIADVVERRASLALVNPAVMLTLAVRGTGPFDAPLPLRAIAVMPSFDVFAFVVTPGTGLASLEDVRARRFPLRISMRGQRNHSIYPVLHTVLAAAGTSLDEIIGWGGSLEIEPGFDAAGKSGFDSPARVEMARSGTINAIFDEAVYRWLPAAQAVGMHPLPLGENTLRNLERLGFRRNVVAAADYPPLDADVETIDFSGFAIFVHADAPDALVTAICAGLDVRRACIPWEGYGPLPVAAMVRDTSDGPLDVLLHPAAERYWHGLGYVTGTSLPGRGRMHALRHERPPRIRSMLVLEVAAEILSRADASGPQAYATTVHLRGQAQADGERWTATMCTAPDAAADVAILGDDCRLTFRDGVPADVVSAIRAAADAIAP